MGRTKLENHNYYMRGNEIFTNSRLAVRSIRDCLRHPGLEYGPVSSERLGLVGVAPRNRSVSLRGDRTSDFYRGHGYLPMQPHPTQTPICAGVGCR